MPATDFRILVLPNANASSVAITLDALAAAQALARRSRAPEICWAVHSPAGSPVTLSAGMTVPVRPLPRSVDAASLWIVPGLGIANPSDLAGEMAAPPAMRAATVLRKHVAAGGMVAASCSAVFLLQSAGLLSGRRATTSWWLAPTLQQLEPACAVDSHRMVCDDGPVITAGAAFAQSDLMLYVLRKRCGAALADNVARVLVIDGRQAQTPFVVPAMMASGNELISRITRRLESALPNLPAVAELARELAMNERTLARHVKAATGQTTLALWHGVRLNRARMLIASSRLSIEQVAERVGYSDATALRRLMLKMAGTRPSQFRPNAWTG